MNTDIHLRNTKESVLYSYLERFYDNRDYFSKLKAIVNTKTRKTASTVSLRLLDYICTLYTDKKATTFDRELERIKESYLLYLDSYKKQYYDCFKRARRIPFEKNGEVVVTTLGQLMFFKFIIEQNVVQYAEANLATIKDNMAVELRTQKTTRPPTIRRRTKRKRD